MSVPGEGEDRISLVPGSHLVTGPMSFLGRVSLVPCSFQGQDIPGTRSLLGVGYPRELGILRGNQGYTLPPSPPPHWSEGHCHGQYAGFPLMRVQENFENFFQSRKSRKNGVFSQNQGKIREIFLQCVDR